MATAPEKLVTQLIKRISTRDTVRRGAVSRVAERLGVANSTVASWVFGNRTPSPLVLDRLKTLLSDKSADFSAKKSGPKSNGIKALH